MPCVTIDTLEVERRLNAAKRTTEGTLRLRRGRCDSGQLHGTVDWKPCLSTSCRRPSYAEQLEVPVL